MNTVDTAEEIKTIVLRPLADKFQELTRQIDSGEYELPKTIADAEKITEAYITQAWERLEALISSLTNEAELRGRTEELNWVSAHAEHLKRQKALRYPELIRGYNQAGEKLDTMVNERLAALLKLKGGEEKK